MPRAGSYWPVPAYECQHNLLASLSELYGTTLPRTLLCEHYRCDPVIIGFCNKKFYGGELIPYTSGGGERPMIVVRTVEGNHMRQHHEGGRSNQREIDVIAEEVIPEHCQGFAKPILASPPRTGTKSPKPRTCSIRPRLIPSTNSRADKSRWSF